MAENLRQASIHYGSHFANAFDIDLSILDFSARSFLPEHGCAFCTGCSYARDARCSSINVHLYGCFESDRWSGLYVYYCPAGLAFAAAAIYKEKTPFYAYVCGPIVPQITSGEKRDLDDSNMREKLRELPTLAPDKVTSISQVLWTQAMFLSGRGSEEHYFQTDTGGQIPDSAYEAFISAEGSGDSDYPMEIERRLRQMITFGDKQGAQEMINELLGHIYFQYGGDFDKIKEKASELVVLFSRASIEGGADVSEIFGTNRDVLKKIESFDALDELSVYLTAIFYRFVGYVFDFNQVKHADVMHRVVGYIRDNHMKKISLDEVADHVYLSKSYLSKIFNDEMHVSFTDFVNSVRVEKSKEHLLSGTQSLASIATTVGFSDQSYFTKIFRKTVGVSPGQYRKYRGKIS